MNTDELHIQELEPGKSYLISAPPDATDEELRELQRHLFRLYQGANINVLLWRNTRLAELTVGMIDKLIADLQKAKDGLDGTQ